MADSKTITDAKNNRIHFLLESFSKCKSDFMNEANECKRLREISSKLEIDLKEARSLEKSHRIQLSTSREMISNLQETVSQLVYLRRDVKKLRDEIENRNSVIVNFEKEKEAMQTSHTDQINNIKLSHEKHIEELIVLHERKIKQVQQDSDTQVAQFTCTIEELRSKMKDMEAEHSDKMNVVVLEYEERIERGAAQAAQLQEQLARQAAATDANIDAYRRRLEELEEKLKQNQFKHYLAQSTHPSQYESQVERPYCDKDPYETNSVGMNPVFEAPKLKFMPIANKSKTNALQVTYHGRTPNTPKTTEKKGQFNITKKRKLYSDKDFQDF